MKISKWVAVCLLICAFAPKSAYAIPYTFSEGNWPGGGEITGGFDIDLDYSTVTPGLLYADALTSFSAHWSGNIYSQPYDWDLRQVSSVYFLFSLSDGRTFDMVLGGDVQYDSDVHLVWDFRPTATVIGPDSTLAQYYGTGPLVFSRANSVPDAAPTAPLLVVALVALFGLTRLSKLRARWLNRINPPAADT
jgi:hypothetical protein